MALSQHIKVDDLIKQAQDHRHRKHVQRNREFHDGPYNSRYDTEDVPKFTVPTTGISAKAAYQLVHDELELDGSPALNFASFVHTWMPEEATQLFIENIGKNFADQDEYPATMAIHTRCISMIADMWKAPKGSKAIGTATTGSSEAIMLGGLAMKKRWQERRKAEGKDHFHPNVIMGANAQVAIEKFARYFDVECRLVPVTAEGGHVMSPKDAIKYVDENTIGVFVILGSTYTGGFEDVKGMSDLLDKHQEETGLDIPIHVDAASGGFFAPFAYPKYKWSFEIPRVRSINTSGHKFGLTYVGLGWIVWKDEQYLPKDLIFELHYLGSIEYSYTLNFSRPAAPILGQMFNFLHLGFEGYRNIALADLKNARVLSRALELSGYFRVVSNVHLPLPEGSTIMGAINKAVGTAADESDKAETYYPGLPVVAFTFSDKYKQDNPHVKQAWVQNLLRQKQWIVPNYNLPPAEDSIEILRIVVRESMTADIIEHVITDICEIAESLAAGSSAAAMMATISAGRDAQTKQQTNETGNGTGRIEDDHKVQRKPERKQTAYAKQC